MENPQFQAQTRPLKVAAPNTPLHIVSEQMKYLQLSMTLEWQQKML